MALPTLYSPDVPLSEGAHDGHPVCEVALLVQHVLPLLVALKDHVKLPVEGAHRIDGGRQQVPRDERRGRRRQVLLDRACVRANTKVTGRIMKQRKLP